MSCSLKKKYSLLFKHSLSLSILRGQNYDGVSNMREEIKGLKTLIMKNTTSTYYIRCFSHQLQLIFIAIGKKHWMFKTFLIMFECC